MESLHQLYKIGHGPSSSHTMGPEKASKYILATYPTAKEVVVTLYGSLALTGKGHLTDHIILQTLKRKVKTEIKFDYLTETKHPNTMVFEVYDKDRQLLDKVTVYSIGGGSIEIEGIETTAENEVVYPFKSFEEIKQYCIENNLNYETFLPKNNLIIKILKNIY